MERLAAALPIEQAASRWIVSSDPDEHVEKIQPYIDLGFKHLVFHAPGPDQERFLRLCSGAGAARSCGSGSVVAAPPPDPLPARGAAPKVPAPLAGGDRGGVELRALPGLPLVRPGDDLAALIARRAARGDHAARVGLRRGGAELVLKAENRLVGWPA